jgi:tRNA/tmRNA/rRNA uracil-C5-methylase (TrmA/RlmC/RlmD family)
VEYFVAAAGSDPEKFLQGADVAILDPPRKGIEPELLDYFCNANGRTSGSDDESEDSASQEPITVNRLLYLSCGFSAFERDCQRLLGSGLWKLVSAEGFLFFPGADHIETLAVFDRIET